MAGTFLPSTHDRLAKEQIATHQLRRRLSPSLLVSLLALTAAMGGTAAAAGFIITDPSQIQDGS